MRSPWVPPWSQDSESHWSKDTSDRGEIGPSTVWRVIAPEYRRVSDLGAVSELKTPE
jgi:hypothetical protein